MHTLRHLSSQRHGLRLQKRRDETRPSILRGSPREFENAIDGTMRRFSHHNGLLAFSDTLNLYGERRNVTSTPTLFSTRDIRNVLKSEEKQDLGVDFAALYHL